MNDQTELRKQRRVIEPSQFAELVNAASNGSQEFRGLNGSDHAMIYLLACYTGLRASEIGSLEPSSFSFGESPVVTVKAADTKNSKTARLPLKSDLAGQIESYLDRHPSQTLSLAGKPGLVWPGNWSDEGAEMIRIDLKSAGIPYAADDGDYDFHALRHQFITNIFRAGISHKVA